MGEMSPATGKNPPSPHPSGTERKWSLVTGRRGLPQSAFWSRSRSRRETGSRRGGGRWAWRPGWRTGGGSSSGASPPPPRRRRRSRRPRVCRRRWRSAPVSLRPRSCRKSLKRVSRASPRVIFSGYINAQYFTSLLLILRPTLLFYIPAHYFTSLLLILHPCLLFYIPTHFKLIDSLVFIAKSGAAYSFEDNSHNIVET